MFFDKGEVQLKDKNNLSGYCFLESTYFVLSRRKGFIKILRTLEKNCVHNGWALIELVIFCYFIKASLNYSWHLSYPKHVALKNTHTISIALPWFVQSPANVFSITFATLVQVSKQ